MRGVVEAEGSVGDIQESNWSWRWVKEGSFEYEEAMIESHDFMDSGQEQSNCNESTFMYIE